MDQILDLFRCYCFLVDLPCLIWKHRKHAIIFCISVLQFFLLPLLQQRVDLLNFPQFQIASLVLLLPLKHGESFNLHISSVLLHEPCSVTKEAYPHHLAVFIFLELYHLNTWCMLVGTSQFCLSQTFVLWQLFAKKVPGFLIIYSDPSHTINLDSIQL